jgi:hypothetical protein
LNKGKNIVKWIEGQGYVGWVTWREWRTIECPKRSSFKNWKGRDEEEDQGKDVEKKWKEIFKCWE